MKQPLIYIAGKVTGEPIQEREQKFEKAMLQLKEIKYNSINPIEIISDYLIENPNKSLLSDNELWQLAMKLCISQLIERDAVLLLNDWTQSKGAIIESELAEKLGIPRFTNIHDIVKHFENERAMHNVHN